MARLSGLAPNSVERDAVTKRAEYARAGIPAISFFPYTEPSAEVDVGCIRCGGRGCPVCKHTGWLEILGSGLIDPEVLKIVGYAPDVYSGFAFGLGVERIAMLKYGIDDIRMYYENDLRFLSQF